MTTDAAARTQERVSDEELDALVAENERLRRVEQAAWVVSDEAIGPTDMDMIVSGWAINHLRAALDATDG